MILIIIILVHLSLIVLEVYYETLIHKAKTSTDGNQRVKYAKSYYRLQLLIIFVIFLYGYYISTICPLLSWTTVAIICSYVATRFFIFELIYRIINELNNTYISSVDKKETIICKLTKKLIQKSSIKYSSLIRMSMNLLKMLIYLGSIYLLYKVI